MTITVCVLFALLQRAFRAVWLLCGAGCLPALPPQEPSWPLPSRTAPHLNLASAMGSDVSRLQQLFPELQAAFAVGNDDAAASPDGVCAAVMEGAASGTAAVAPATAPAAAAACGPLQQPVSCTHALGEALSEKLCITGRTVTTAAAAEAEASAAASCDTQCKVVVTDSAAEPVGCQPLAKLGRHLGAPTVAELAAAAAEQQACAAAAEPFYQNGVEHAEIRNMVSHCTLVHVASCQQCVLLYADKPTLYLVFMPAMQLHCLRSIFDHMHANITPTLPPLPQLHDLTRVDCSQQLRNTVVFDSTQPPAAGWHGSHAPHSRPQSAGHMVTAASRSSAAPGVLQFDSCFEGGNLRMAVHVRGNEYDLLMSNDLNDRCVAAALL